MSNTNHDFISSELPKMTTIYTAQATSPVTAKRRKTLAYSSPELDDVAAWLVAKTQKGWIAEPITSYVESDGSEDSAVKAFLG